MILIVYLMLEDPFAILWKLYQESLKRRTASKEFNMKLLPKVIDVSGIDARLCILLSKASEDMTRRKTLLELLFNHLRICR